ncbi:hypothetical protein NLG97_g92 [Lecanicillium saksenae]|uniref:Uncharacterized protein n=1 Tax=Lecanicillium saksenae TaxID=468837 RepID=A0ACC1RA70_9HYPO|nr:hypothetical protein NLG97_g92 [Lecanicillium saksenae]
MMTSNEKGPTPTMDEITVATSYDDSIAEAAAATDAAPDTNERELEAANTTLASRPRRSLRNSGRVAEETTVKKPAKIVAKRPQRKWDAERLLTDPKSPLAKANLRSILSNPIAWNSLDAEEQNEIVALFPDQRHIITDADGTSRPNMESLMNDDSFRYDCAAYTENLLQGRHDPEWLAQAWAAHERRKAGDFKEFLRAKFERDWEVKLPDKSNVASEQQKNAERMEIDAGSPAGMTDAGLGQVGEQTG